MRLVKGSHIVLPQLYEGEHAFILQNDDRRVVFMIPYGEHPHAGRHDRRAARATSRRTRSRASRKIDYLCRAVERYLRAPPRSGAWCGAMPACGRSYDDGSAGRLVGDARLHAARGRRGGRAPVLSVFGGKITTYRRLAEHAMEKLAPYFPGHEGRLDRAHAAAGQRFRRIASARRSARCFFASHRGKPSGATLRRSSAATARAQRGGRRRRSGRGLSAPA